MVSKEMPGFTKNRSLARPLSVFRVFSVTIRGFLIQGDGHWAVLVMCASENGIYLRVHGVRSK